MHHPELRQGERHALAAPAHAEALYIELEEPALEPLLGGSRLGGKLGATEERCDARQQVRQAHVLGQVIVGTEAQPGHHVEVAVARGEEDDRQRRRKRAQVPAQGEAAVDVRAQADVDQGEIGEPRPQGAERFAAPGVGRHLEAVLAQRLGIVGADGRVVFNDGDAAGHRGRL